MTLDKIHPLKMETIESGGDSDDDYPTSADSNHDFIDVRGVVIQDNTSNDDAVVLGRESGNMMFQDEHVPPVSLSALTAGGFDFNNIVWDVAGGVVYANDENAVTRV